MPQEREIRAKYGQKTIVVYQAYAPDIADKAIHHQTFVSPFSLNRMTWIKPSFLWLMHRSNWGQKKSQERVLAVHISRSGWEKALRLGVLTHFEPTVHADPETWRSDFENAKVHIQWDTERSLRGAGLNYFSIQVGISRHLIQEFVSDWIVKIEDLTPLVRKIRMQLENGKSRGAKLVPSERLYPVDEVVAKRIQMDLSLIHI